LFFFGGDHPAGLCSAFVSRGGGAGGTDWWGAGPRRFFWCRAMSIAISETVATPVLPIRLTRVMSVAVAVLGAAFLAGKRWFPDLPASIEYVAAAACFAAALMGLRRSTRIDRTHRIVITPEGVLNVFPENRYADPEVASPGKSLPANVERIVCRPNLVILSYRDGGEGRGTVFLTPRSVPPGAFRPLCVALRWITLQNDPAQGEPR
ncbi:MAG: hypothetical protein ACTHL1_13845, partial [Burkholderiaceae bacterium]